MFNLFQFKKVGNIVEIYFYQHSTFCKSINQFCKAFNQLYLIIDRKNEIFNISHGGKLILKMQSNYYRENIKRGKYEKNQLKKD